MTKLLSCLLIRTLTAGMQLHHQTARLTAIVSFLALSGCCSTADLLAQVGYMDGQQWMAAWEAAWQRNLDSCDADGHCLIQVT